jgi:hypothetical protein
MNTPRAINVKTTDKRLYRIIWDDMPDFYNKESSEWDAIPALFYGCIWMEDKQEYSLDAYLLLACDVDSVEVIW